MATANAGGQFTHLHVHTHYSILDGIADITQLVATAQRQGAHSLAITDHGVMYGAVEFHDECKAKGINPIIGCEVYVAEGSRHDRNNSSRSSRHLTLLSKDNDGYQNLIQMVSKGHLEGFYQKPRVDRELLQLHSEGIYCLSGCMSGELASLLAFPGAEVGGAIETAQWYAATFPNRYFLEIQRHQNVPNLDIFNRNLIQLSQATGLPLVATNDSHYVTPEQHSHHELYMAIQTNAAMDDEDRLHMGDGSYYLKSPAEMTELFSDLPEAIDNSVLIGQDCHVNLDFDQKRMPHFQTPDGQTAHQYLRQLCEEGFKRLCPHGDARYRQQLEHELDVILKTEFADYFLIVWDIISFVRRRKIRFGVRGSAAASLVLYCLGITDVDPLTYNLVFERFLNIERKEMPDIDMDFQDDRRDEALNYVVERYGRDQVAQIITFGKYRPKSAIKAAGRALQIPRNVSDGVAAQIPAKSTSIQKAAEEQPEIQRMMGADEKVRDLVQQASGLEDIVHQLAPHPAGVVIASEPLANIVPLQRPTDSKSDLNLTQYSMDPIAKLGLVKMDFLGLTNLTILDKVLKSIPEAPQNLADIPLDDRPTYQLLGTGNTSNVFQLESAGMQRHIADLKPSNLGDIAAMIALYRPGPMENIDRFIRSKHGREQISYPHPSMKEMLDETYGVIVYQDQVLQIMKDFAGYSLGEADIVRKAMGKKIPELMREQRAAFLEGAAQQGYDNKTATSIFDLIEPFAGYAFNKAHSISYALISYWTAYFKANHRVQYMTAALNCRQDDRDAYRSTIAECQRSGITLLLPSVNQSQAECTVEGENTIRLGFSAVTTVGTQTAAPILEERQEKGPYTSLADFCNRAPRQNVSAKQIDLLIKAGILDDIVERGYAVQQSARIWETINTISSARETGQLSMFGNTPQSDDASDMPWTTPPTDHSPATPKQKAQWENETLSIALSWTPANIPDKSAITSIADIPDQERQQATVAGFIDAVSRKTTRDQRTFLEVRLNLADGPIEVMVWPASLEKQDESLWAPHSLVRITGALTRQSEGYSLAADQISSLDAYDPKNPQNPTGILSITIDQHQNEQHDRHNYIRAMRILVDHPGPDQVQVRYGNLTIEIPTITVDHRSNALREKLAAIEGVAV